jgi:peptidoglycan lytic transglycosylase
MSVCRVGMPAHAVRWVRLGTVGVGVAFALSGCANESVRQHYAHGHEYFSQAKYGHASPKVIADGQPVPKGGGQYLLGHPYRIAGHTYVPTENESYTAVGMASWYGAAFHGRRTANGEVYDMASITAAHPTMPLPSYARVTNLSNGYSVIVRVNDRGPYHGGRVMDVSSRTADVLGFKGEGTARIRVEYVGRAPLEGSDDGALLASLRTDGSPANLNGYSSPVMVASASEPGPSIFGGLFGSGRSENVAARPAPPPPEPEPVRIAAAPAPPEPIRESQPELVQEAPRAMVAVHQPHGPVPLPPPRPFELGASHSSTVVAVASRPKSTPIAVLPPRRPLVQASAEKALYYSAAPAGRLKPPKGAFDRATPGQGPSKEE